MKMMTGLMTQKLSLRIWIYGTLSTSSALKWSLQKLDGKSYNFFDVL